ncbi:hypothetical protein FO519_007099 [Halicephalobus sp. NKZ332]|nr:hypothetical protein FO519_007099 [Halicephalobus sp. NKZ332]
MNPLAADPPSAQVPATGGTSSHSLVNSGASRIAFKVKSSNNDEYRLKPVFGFVDPEAASPVEIFLEAPDEVTDLQSLFKERSPQGEVVLRIKAE